MLSVSELCEVLLFQDLIISIIFIFVVQMIDPSFPKTSILTIIIPFSVSTESLQKPNLDAIESKLY